MLTKEKVQKVQESWLLVLPIADQAAALFYGRLFELDPSLRALFHTDMKEQGKKLMQMITVAVKSLDRLHEVVPAVQALGRRHVQYGVTDQMYDTVGAALLWTLEQGLGAHFTAETREAWTLVYTTLANVMKEAGREALAA